LLALVIAVVALASDIPDGYVRTPYGVRPKECVLELPSGSRFSEHEDGLLVTTPEGQYIHPVPSICHEDDVLGKYNEKTKQKMAGKVDSTAFPLNGWLDYAGWYPPSGEDNINYFSSTYLIPGDPPSDAGQVLFYFIGSQDNAYAAVNILQPVLTWGNGVKGWNLASWCCCPKNISVQSKTISGLKAGQHINGIIKRVDSVTWDIESIVQETGANTTLTPQVGSYLYDWADVTLEVYSVTACNQFATGPCVFSALNLKDVQGDTLTPAWQLTKTTQCNGVIQSSGANSLSITHSTTVDTN